MLHTGCDDRILNYFDGRYTSTAVEGINNKARAIAKRCYGVKWADTPWNRLILELNRASEVRDGRFGLMCDLDNTARSAHYGDCETQ